MVAPVMRDHPELIPTVTNVPDTVEHWLLDCIPWVSPDDPATGEPATAATHTDHTGLRTSLNQYRLPRRSIAAA